MPKLESSNPNGGAPNASTRQSPKWIGALICLIMAILLAAAFLDYAPEQTSYFNTNPIDV